MGSKLQPSEPIMVLKAKILKPVGRVYESLEYYRALADDAYQKSMRSKNMKQRYNFARVARAYRDMAERLEHGRVPADDGRNVRPGTGNGNAADGAGAAEG
jgi:hypothetical protein